MNFEGINIPQKLVPNNYLQLGLEAQRVKQRHVKELLEKRKLPENGWRDEEIEELVHQLAALDSNNFAHNVGLGEREARIACRLVARRHYNFGHGIGRSGDLLEAQPKAAGSTLLAALTNALLFELLQMLGMHSCRGCFLVPMATGMTLMLCLQALRKRRPNAKYVLWSRIDQKSCFKAITAAGLQPIVIPCLLLEQEQSLITDCEKFKEKIEELGADSILCLYTTTSCFAPRNSDNIVAIAKLAKSNSLPHLVNNAYGLQVAAISGQLEKAQRVGRIDYFVQSTDKNLLVPVGGAIVASSDEQLLQHLASCYAGRASSSQTLDVFMTLLSLGCSGYQSLLVQRQQRYQCLKQRLQQFAKEHNETVPQMADNHISLALTLGTLTSCPGGRNIVELGAMLHTRGISGVRVVPVAQLKSIDGYEFKHFGAHHDLLEVPYLTVAASLGITCPDIDKFFEVLEKCWTQFNKTTDKQ
ncbi:O-phosphoseryl-tRNA(Sec) selenium transferase [Drosophila grimshawi]|uniref:O-phosphoseryl-tRNA(Sec) selenium transferase n=1 Tax=Drosophila grimshawi TaxID=7222 RepID=B4JST2_DROGR|nr:O-phosphoseryl-tRNA(Sec) selenium transferase [Drosophila grimshawi]EDV94822.1 GH22940 [Drosophila grimshawi]